MNKKHSVGDRREPGGLDRRLSAYLAAAGGAATVAASSADAAVVGNGATQAININSEINIDFNADGQTDFQVDHDRYDLGNSNVVDYLQIDKNDVNGETNPLPMDGFVGFPEGSTTPNDSTNAAYVNSTSGAYPSALTQGTLIGPGSSFDFQEGDNYFGGGTTIRANRLIDEDRGQIDQQVGGLSSSQITLPTDGPNWLGLSGEVRYLGVRMKLNGAAESNYGWIGVRIDNEADATGAVVGYAYESTPGQGILAGDLGPFVPNGDYDDDSDVDGNDFLIWQRQNGTSVTAGTGADGTGDGQVNGADLQQWRNDFGTTVAAAAGHPAAAAVPEPGSLLIGVLTAGLLAVAMVFSRRGRKSRAA